MTSIEWLGFHLNSKLFDKVSSKEWEEINDIFKLAHKKHKQEIMEAYDKGEFDCGCNGTGEDYYNKTFKNQQ